MKDVDIIRVRDLIGQINAARKRMEQLAASSEEEFLSDFRNTESAKYLFVVAIEAAIDLCNHIVSRRKSRAPQDYADCFAILADLNAISHGLTEHLRKMARFRNLLVHLYWEVDNRKVYSILKSVVENLDHFVDQILSYLEL